MKKTHLATLFALLAAALYAINIPLSKLLLEEAPPTMMAAFLYLGAGIGMGIWWAMRRALGVGTPQEPLTRRELPYTVAMIVLDIAAPILLMCGITRTNSANVSLLNNFEIVATSLLALLLFHEVISRRLWLAIVLVTLASGILSFEGEGAFSLNEGSLLVLLACLCWGLENNCTRQISNKSAEEIVIFKGFGSGLGSLIIALTVGERLPAASTIGMILALGFVAYGLSIRCYILAQKDLGAAKTSAYYSIAPFLGVAFSMALLGERPGLSFYVALLVMVLATVLIARDTVALQHAHLHSHVHTHAHSHGGYSHTHAHTHSHSHLHVHQAGDALHTHSHQELPGHDHVHG